MRVHGSLNARTSSLRCELVTGARLAQAISASRFGGPHCLPAKKLRLAFISKGDIPPDGLQPHTDTLREFPYLGTPHAASAEQA